MEFLVQIKVNWPPNGDPALKERLMAAEVSRARELAEAGKVHRLWRVPGRWANVGIWDAKDASDLHEAISSLPLFPWLDVTVTALAKHPSDPGLAT